MLTNFNRFAMLFLFTFLVLGNAHAQPNNTSKIFSSVENDKKAVKKVLPLRPKLDPKRSDDPKYVAEMWWEYFGYRSKEEATDILEKQKQTAEQMGFKWYPPQPGNPDHVQDYFDMPTDELLSGCTYAKGYSYPSICTNNKGNVIFDSSVDGQWKLDAIAISQGRLGKYNKMPKEKPKSTTSETMYLDD